MIFQDGKLLPQVFYYYMGHVSKFVPRGSKRIGLQSSDSSSVLSTAFRTPAGEIVVVAMNPWDGPAHVDLRDVARAEARRDGPAASFDRDAYFFDLNVYLNFRLVDENVV